MAYHSQTRWAYSGTHDRITHSLLDCSGLNFNVEQRKKFVARRAAISASAAELEHSLYVRDRHCANAARFPLAVSPVQLCVCLLVCVYVCVSLPGRLQLPYASLTAAVCVARSASRMPVNFGDVSVECVFGIVKYLSFGDRLRFEPVNRAFGSAIKQVWDTQRALRVESHTPFSRSHFFNCSTPSHQVRVCDAVTKGNYSDHDIVQLIKKCRNLEAFEWNVGDYFPRDILETLNACPKLQHIFTCDPFYVDNKKNVDFPSTITCLLFDEHFPRFTLGDNLETLCFRGEMHSRLESIRHELVKLPRLKKLVFNFTGDAMDEDDNVIYTKLCTGQDCMFEDVDVLPNLESISLSLCSHFSYLEAMPNLSELIIHSDSLDSSFPDFVKLCGSQIKAVQITGYSRQFLSTLFECAPNIERLAIDDNLITEIIKYELKNLRLIEINVYAPQSAILTPLIKKLVENSSKLRTILIPIAKPQGGKVNLRANNLIMEVAKFARAHPLRQINAFIGANINVALPSNVNYKLNRVNHRTSRLAGP